jgi:hypothetical protein
MGGVPHHAGGQSLHPPSGMTVAGQLDKPRKSPPHRKIPAGPPPPIPHVINGDRINKTERTGQAPTLASRPKACRKRLAPISRHHKRSGEIACGGIRRGIIKWMIKALTKQRAIHGYYPSHTFVFGEDG